MKPEKLPQISEAEFEVMKIIWKYAPINTNQVTENAGIRHGLESENHPDHVKTPGVKKSPYL